MSSKTITVTATNEEGSQHSSSNRASPATSLSKEGLPTVADQQGVPMVYTGMDDQDQEQPNPLSEELLLFNEGSVGNPPVDTLSEASRSRSVTSLGGAGSGQPSFFAGFGEQRPQPLAIPEHQSSFGVTEREEFVVRNYLALTTAIKRRYLVGNSEAQRKDRLSRMSSQTKTDLIMDLLNANSNFQEQMVEDHQVSLSALPSPTDFRPTLRSALMSPTARRFSDSVARTPPLLGGFYHSSPVPPPAHSNPPSSVASLVDAPLTTTATTAMLQLDAMGNDVINDYTIIGELGRGAHSIVELAEDNSTGELFAIKSISRSLQRHHQGQTLDGVMTEIAIMKKLHHKNIVRLHHVIDDPMADKLYLVLQYVPKGALLRVDSDGSCTPLPLDVATKYFRQLVTGLQYLHRHNIMHRDIKPENILLDDDDNVYLSDFGVSSQLDDEDNIAKTEGTPAFFSPETCRGEGHLHPQATDIWALGVSFFLMVVGRSPFRSGNFRTVVHSIQNDAPSIPSSLPADLQDLLRQMLNKDPVTRISLPELRNNRWLAQMTGSPTEEQGQVTVLSSDISHAITCATDAVKMRRLSKEREDGGKEKEGFSGSKSRSPHVIAFSPTNRSAPTAPAAGGGTDLHATGLGQGSTPKGGLIRRGPSKVTLSRTGSQRQQPTKSMASSSRNTQKSREEDTIASVLTPEPPVSAQSSSPRKVSLSSPQQPSPRAVHKTL